ncbi:MAG: GntR family transcriptional regulator [Prevotellaceae bacterium]|jgi:DNA-binding transcriptional regulator YhcF (GntR family)|nr:GntR family transcriptional regulator [Prevotellaceae bacterium]
MSIDFKTSKGIFLQIAENLCRQILVGALPVGGRVPSVRDLAAEYEVNRNTVLRTYQILSDEGIIENQRGVGFFVATNALEHIKKREKDSFFAHDLPNFIQKVKLLNITAEDLSELLKIVK